MYPSYVVVGAFARIADATASVTRVHLDRVEGVSTFDLPRPGTLGLLIEAADVDAAHAVLTGAVRGAPGVLGVWPVSVEAESAFEETGTE